MSLGPIEMFVVGFPDNGFNGEIAPALADLVESGTIRVVDLLFIAKDTDGAVASFELNELDDDIFGAYDTLVDEVHNLIGEEDVEDFADELEPGSSIALLVIEHVWAKPFADAVAGSGGTLLGSIHIPREVVEELTA